MTGLYRDLLAAAQRIALDRIFVDRDHAVVEREVDVLAAPTGHAPEQRRIDRGYSVDAGVHVGQRDPEQRRRLAGDSDHGHRAALRLGNEAESRVVGVRAAVAVGRDRAVNEPRIALGQIRVAETEPVERSRPVVLDEDVRAVDEPMHQLESARVPHVHAEPLFAHVLLQEVAAVPVDEVGVRPSGVALGRTLDLDDFRAHGCKAPGQERAGEKVAVVDDAYPAKRRRRAVGPVGLNPLGHGASLGRMKQSMRPHTGMEPTHRRRPHCIDKIPCAALRLHHGPAWHGCSRAYRLRDRSHSG